MTIRTFSNKRITIFLLFALLLSGCAVPVPTQASSVAKPQSNSSGGGGSLVGNGLNTDNPIVFDLDSGSQRLPTNVDARLKEVSVAAFHVENCQPNTLVTLIPPSDVFYLGQSLLYSICDLGKKITLEISMPDGKKFIPPTQSVKEVFVDSIVRQVIYIPTISTLSNKSGTYVFTLKGESRFRPFTLELKKYAGSKTFYAMADGFFFDRYAPNETVRLFVYAPNKFKAWKLLTMDANGQLVVRANSSEILAGPCYTAIGDKSGELTIAAQGLAKDNCNNVIKGK